MCKCSCEHVHVCECEHACVHRLVFNSACLFKQLTHGSGKPHTLQKTTLSRQLAKSNHFIPIPITIHIPTPTPLLRCIYVPSPKRCPSQLNPPPTTPPSYTPTPTHPSLFSTCGSSIQEPPTRITHHTVGCCC